MLRYELTTPPEFRPCCLSDSLMDPCGSLPGRTLSAICDSTCWFSVSDGSEARPLLRLRQIKSIQRNVARMLARCDTQVAFPRLGHTNLIDLFRATF